MLASSAHVIEFQAEIPEVFEDLFHPKRYKIYYGGRGGSKSWGFADALLIMGTQRPLRILCTRELQKSITDSVHKLLSDQIDSLGLHEFYQIQNKTIIGLNGTEFLFEGLKHNIREIKSKEGIDICWVEEAENVSDASWEILIPTIRKEASEIWISFNTKHPTDATFRRFVLNADEDMIVKKVSYADNPFFPDVLDKERLKLQRDDPEAYKHIWEGEFDTRYSGAIYAKQVARLKEQGRITDKVKWDEAYPVYTAWDLGEDDSTAIWFYQQGGGEIVVLEYYENNNMEGIGHYCEYVQAKPYKYGGHYVPHDAGQKLQAAGGRSIVEQAWRDYKVKMSIIPETTHVQRQEAARKTIPVCFFHETNCADGLDALMFYHYAYDEDKQTFKNKPVHDWSSHGSTAFEILARVWQIKVPTVKEMNSREIKNAFFSLRSKHGLEKRDPYRIKPMAKK